MMLRSQKWSEVCGPWSGEEKPKQVPARLYGRGELVRLTKELGQMPADGATAACRPPRSYVVELVGTLQGLSGTGNVVADPGLGVQLDVGVGEG